jgi:hypothetical protein
MSADLNHLHQLITLGDHRSANQWLKENANDFKGTPFGKAKLIYYQALCSSDQELKMWERAIEALKVHPPSILLLRAYKEAQYWAQVGSDILRQRDYLHKSVELAKTLSGEDEALELRAVYAHRLLLDGLPERAQEEMIRVVQDAILQNKELLIISEGTILAGLYMHANRWRDTAALCIAIESAAQNRSNWLAFAAGRMMRASAWVAENKISEGINLLFETGDHCFDVGAVAGLHLVRARLVELQIKIGEAQFQALSGRQF